MINLSSWFAIQVCGYFSIQYYGCYEKQRWKQKRLEMFTWSISLSCTEACRLAVGKLGRENNGSERGAQGRGKKKEESLPSFCSPYRPPSAFLLSFYLPPQGSHCGVTRDSNGRYRKTILERPITFKTFFYTQKNLKTTLHKTQYECTLLN